MQGTAVPGGAAMLLGRLQLGSRPAPPRPAWSGVIQSDQYLTNSEVPFWYYHAMPADRGRLCRATLQWLLLFKCDLRPARSPAPRPAVKQLSVVVFWPIFPVLLHSARLLFVVCLPIPSTTQFHSNTTTAVLFT